MHYFKSTIAALTFGGAALIVAVPVSALDIGGQNGISVGSNGSGGLGVSVGGTSGINASVGGTSGGGLGVNASVGGASGINSSTSVGGSTSNGLGVGTTASVGGSSGVNANVGANVGGSRLATANATAGVGSNTLLNVVLGVPSVADPDYGISGTTSTSGRSNTNDPGRSSSRTTQAAINDMSAADRAKAKLRCKDVLRSGSYDASLTKLCKMVIAMR